MKFLFMLMAVPVMFVAQAGILPEVFSEANVVQFFNDGQQVVMSESEEARFDELFVEAISGSRQMPAFAVAIHKLTMEDFKEGYWVKFDYGKKMNASGLPFNQLLIHVQQNSSGINIIRGNNGRFDGRCFYLDLDGNLDEVYDFLATIEGQPQEKLEVEIESGEKQEFEIKEDKKEDKDEDNSADDESGSDGDDSSEKAASKPIKEEKDDTKISDGKSDSEDALGEMIEDAKTEEYGSKEAEAEKDLSNESDDQTAKNPTLEEEVSAEVQMPAVNDDKKEESKVISIEPAEKTSASAALVEAVSQWGE